MGLRGFPFIYFGCQPDEPLASLVTTNRIINVYGFLVFMMLFAYSVLHCLYSVGNKITTTYFPDNLMVLVVVLDTEYLDEYMAGGTITEALNDTLSEQVSRYVMRRIQYYEWKTLFLL